MGEDQSCADDVINCSGTSLHLRLGRPIDGVCAEIGFSFNSIQ